MPFKLHIFEDEMRKVKDFVLCHPNIETGGDLFGLWRANGDPVVQLIIGPGKNCRRTTVSFHQDTSYLARVGTYVNSEFMLCHIGSWHSHHHLSLTQPSAGDRSTVCNNFPEGLKRYIMIIVNIARGTSGQENVVLHPYMFTKGGHLCEPGSVTSIPGRSPFREHGLVVACIGNGIEHSLATDAYSSRVPLEYQNRPSTQSKHIPTSGNSYSPHPTHQNFTKTDAPDPKPMDVDEPEDYRSSLHSERRVPENNNGVSQWYETEQGCTKLKEIVKEITATMSKNIFFDRDKISKNLTMKFAHGGKNWSINFPESFDNKPAIIVNPLNKDDLSSKNVILDIRRACGCRECQIHENNVHQRAPSRKDHWPSSPKRSYSPTHKKQNPAHPPFSPSKPQPPSPSRHDCPSSHLKRGRCSPFDKSQISQMETRRSQPWYDTGEGKLLVESIKTNIETHLKNSTKVKTKEVMKFKGRTKQLLFYHNFQNWIIEFVSSRDIELKKEEHGKAKCVAKLSSPDDVVNQVMKHCFCSGCQRTARTPSARQGRLGSALVRPKSRHDIPRRSSPRITSTASPRFFETDDGEKKFRRICTQISATLLNGRDVGMERDVISRDIEVKFLHNGKQCSVVFPFTFPRQLPDVCIKNRSYKEVIRQCRNVVHTIRERCM